VKRKNDMPAHLGKVSLAVSFTSRSGEKDKQNMWGNIFLFADE
jgi:hypothetical protein